MKPIKGFALLHVIASLRLSTCAYAGKSFIQTSIPKDKFHYMIEILDE